jgi:O-antigen/teichoic acid export membrane protein
MIIGSLPYFLNGCATGAYGKLDVTLLGILSTGPEVGWYVAASSITGLTLLITPLIDWVLTPVFARGAVRSREDLYRHVRQAIEPIVAVAIPAALLVSVGADVWLRLLFGHAFAPAATALRILAASSVVIYVAIVYAMTLIMLGRAWTLTLVSVAALAVNVALNLFLIGRVRAWLGDGGGGVGCAIAALATHVFAASMMIAFVGREAFDARTLRMTLKSLGACAVVVVVDRLLASLGGARIAVDLAVYLSLVLGTGALRVGDMFRLVRAAVRGKAQTAA